MSIVDSLGELINRGLAAQAQGLRVMLPGKIDSFDPATQKANVKPLLFESYVDANGVEKSESLPVVPSVPVVFSRGHTFPVSAGDTCMLLFCDRSLDVWLARGGDVDPLDVRRHDLTDAVAIMGLRPFSAPLSSFDNSRARVGEVGHYGLAVGSGGTELGVNETDSATEQAILGTTYHTNEATFLNALSTGMSGLSTAITGAGAAITAAITADPTLGPLSGAATSLNSAGSVLSTLTAAITTFVNSLPASRSSRVKLK